MSKTCLAIRHVPFEDLGTFGPILAARGFAIDYVEAGLDDLSAVDPRAADLMVVLGGPIGAHETDAYPFLAGEVGCVERRLGADRPTLGLCLGSQIMARALGARVYPGEDKEIGWAPVTLTPAGRESCLRPLGADGVRVLHWHGDTYDLPDGAANLASTPAYENQAFAWGRRALGLQFHPEAEARRLEQWFIGHTIEIASTPGVTVEKLRADTAAHAAGLAGAGRAVLEAWLDQVGL